MPKVERREYHESKVTRTMSPTRYGGSAQNVNEFDHSLDNLLEDLQSTVSRPGSSLANGTSTTERYRETSRTLNSDLRSGRSSSAGRLVTTNPVNEYSTDDSYNYVAPDGTRHFKTVKKEHYEYKSAGSGGDMPPERIRMQNNINQLDSLLDDLQQVKQPGQYNNNNNTLDSGYQQYSKSKTYSEKSVAERDVPSYADRSRSIDRSNRNGTSVREIYNTSEGTYGDLKSVRTTSPSPSRSNNSTLSKQTKVTNIHQYPVEVVETSTPDINPEILANLDPELLPSGNTKVTTTIKTYTYEIPGTGSPVDSEKFVYSPNQSASTPSKSFVYNKYENNSLSKNYQTNYAPQSPGSERKVVKETVTTRNYQPNKAPQEPGKTTYIYNEQTTNRKYSDYPPEQYSPQHHHPQQLHPQQLHPQHLHPQQPPSRNTETYIIKESHTTNTINRDSPDRAHLPPVNTTIQRFDSLSNLNARQYPETETFDPKHPPYPYQGRPATPPEVNVTYKYRSTSNTTNNYKTGYPQEEEPLLPRKFPTEQIDGPPKKLDELMANIGNEPPNSPYNYGWAQHEQELAHQRKVDSLKAHQEYEQQKKDAPRTTNVTGPPVYYPPGHEMFASKEEAGAWRAEGGMARESGKYKYEAESKSKTKSSSGAVIIPACLPLCCGLPCTII